MGRRTGGPIPTADDLSVLHLHDRHTELGLSAEDLVGMYRTILTARVLDQKIWSLNRMGKAAFVVSGQGHEGAQVGSAWALRAGHDIVLPYYRDTGVMLTLGMTVEQILLAVLARADDPNSGARQMPNHWGWSAGNVITGSSPIATQLPHAAGLAYAAKLRGEDKVAVSFFGEGATSKGDFHEALNFAGIHQLPMVFVCENNGYAISVPMSSESAVDDVADRAHALRLRRRDRRRQRPPRRVRGGPLGGPPRRAEATAPRSSSARPTATSPTPPTTTTARTARRRRWRRGARRTRCVGSRSTSSSSACCPKPTRSASRPR